MTNVIIIEDYYNIIKNRTYFTKPFLTITKYCLFIFFSWYYIETAINILN